MNTSNDFTSLAGPSSGYNAGPNSQSNISTNLLKAQNRRISNLSVHAIPQPSTPVPSIAPQPSPFLNPRPSQNLRRNNSDSLDAMINDLEASIQRMERQFPENVEAQPNQSNLRDNSQSPPQGDRSRQLLSTGRPREVDEKKQVPDQNIAQPIPISVVHPLISKRPNIVLSSIKGYISSGTQKAVSVWQYFYNKPNPQEEDFGIAGLFENNPVEQPQNNQPGLINRIMEYQAVPSQVKGFTAQLPSLGKQAQVTLHNANGALQAVPGIVNSGVTRIINTLATNTQEIVKTAHSVGKSVVSALKVGTCLGVLLVGAKLYADAVNRRKIPLNEDFLRPYQLKTGIALAAAGFVGTSITIFGIARSYVLANVVPVALNR